MPPAASHQSPIQLRVIALLPMPIMRAAVQVLMMVPSSIKVRGYQIFSNSR